MFFSSRLNMDSGKWLNCHTPTESQKLNWIHSWIEYLDGIFINLKWWIICKISWKLRWLNRKALAFLQNWFLTLSFGHSITAESKQDITMCIFNGGVLELKRMVWDFLLTLRLKNEVHCFFGRHWKIHFPLPTTTKIYL